MHSDEFSQTIGRNYVIALVHVHPDNFAQHINEEASFNTDDVAHIEPLSPRQLARVREMNMLILHDGSVRQDVRPLVVASASSHDSHRGTLPGEINSAIPRMLLKIKQPGLD